MKTRQELLEGFLEFFASPADQQVEYLRKKAMLPETFLKEFVAAFQDLAAGVIDRVADGELNGRQAWRLKQLDDWLREMLGDGDPELWTDAALRSASQWDTTRGMAQDCLLAFRPSPPPVLP